MFESLIEQPPITQELLTKLTGELINRYEIRQICDGPEFGADLTRVSQQLRLYGEVLEQLSPHTLALRAFHQQLFRLLDFLARLSSRGRQQLPRLPLPLPAFCGGCSGLLEHRNIRQMHRELVSSHQMAMGRSERSSESSSSGQEVEISQEEQLVRRMGGLQQNITERQVNLVRCIDDFENMRNDMMLGLRRREFDRDFDSFDLKAYALQLTTHFLSTLTRIEEKIALLKRSIHAVEDQAVQTLPTNDAPPPLPTRIDPKPLPNRSEADFRRLADLKIRLEENCRRFQLELRESQSKVQVLEAQNKGLREEVANERFRREAREKAVRNVQRDEKLKEEERAKRESLELLMSGDQLLVGEFESRFLENYAGSGSRRVSEEDMVPIIKATFKRTFEGFFKHRLSLNLSSRPHVSLLPPTREAQSGERRRASRKKTIRVQGEGDALREFSRFANKRGPSTFLISSQVNYKVMPRALLLASPLNHSTSSASAYKKAVVHTEGSVKRRRNRDHHSKLNSILSELKENQRDHSNDQQLLAKKYSQTMQTEHSEIVAPAKIVHKGRKIKLTRNYSELLDGKFAEENGDEKGKGKGLRLQGVRLMIDSNAVKQFLFLSELAQSSLASRPSHKREQQHLSIQSLSAETPARREKMVLNLQEISYLTNFYSLLAKIHMVDAETYDKLKRWILSKGSEKVEAGRQGLALKQIVSEVVFKHRQCKLTPSPSPLCPHLLALLTEMQSTLKSIDRS